MPIIYRVLTDSARSAPGSKAFVQLAPAVGFNQAGVDYAAGFRNFVLATANPDRDRVVLTDPNPAGASEIESNWAGWRDLGIYQIAINACDSKLTSHLTSQDFYYFESDESIPPIFSRDRRLVQRHFPGSTLSHLSVPSEPLPAFVHRASHGLPISLLSLDPFEPSPLPS